MKGGGGQKYNTVIEPIKKFLVEFRKFLISMKITLQSIKNSPVSFKRLSIFAINPGSGTYIFVNKYKQNVNYSFNII